MKIFKLFIVTPVVLIGLLLLLGSRFGYQIDRSAIRHYLKSAQVGGFRIDPRQLDELAEFNPSELMKRTRQMTLPEGYSSEGSGGQIVFAHIGDGTIPGSLQVIQTEIILVNDSIYDAACKIQFFDDQGNPLKVEIGGKNQSTFTRNLRALRTMRLKTSGTGGVKTGWALLTSDQPVAGTANFTISNRKGKILTDVGVGEAVLKKEFTFFADSKGDTNTAFAFANPDLARTLNVQFDLLNFAGAHIKTVQRTIPKGGHMALYLHELFPQVNNIMEFVGTVRVTGNHDFGGTTLRSVGALLTSVPMVPPVEPINASDRLFFPQVGDGVSGDLKIATTVILFNNTDEAVTVDLSFFESSGTPMTVKLGNRRNSTFTYNIPARGVLRQTTSGQGALKTGWARVEMDSVINGASIFHFYNSKNQLTAEVGVLSAQGSTWFNMISDSLGDFHTGAALANPSEEDEEAEVSLSLFDHNGNQITSKEIVLEPLAHQALFLEELFSEVEGITEFDGRVMVSSDEEIIAVTLRQVGGLTTSVPLTLPVHGFSPVSVLEFAHEFAGSSPLVRWRVEQSATDLALEKMVVSAPELGLNTDGIQTGDMIGYGRYYINRAGIVRLGGVLSAVVSNLGSVEFDIVAAGSNISPGTVLATGKIEGNKHSDLKLTLGPNNTKSGDWNLGYGLEFDLMLQKDLISGPVSAGTVKIATKYQSASTKVWAETFPAVVDSEQPIVFKKKPASLFLEATAPGLGLPGEFVELFGNIPDEETRIRFQHTDGTFTDEPLFSLDQQTGCSPPAGIADGPIQLISGDQVGPALWIPVFFAPSLSAERIPEQSEDQFGMKLVLLQQPGELDIRGFNLVLLEADIDLSALKKDAEVGILRRTGSTRSDTESSLSIVVSETGNDQVQLAVGSTWDPDYVITINKISEDGNLYYTLQMEPVEEPDAPLVHGFSSSMELELSGITISLRSDLPAIIQGEAQSVPNLPNGSGDLGSGHIYQIF